MLRHGEEVTFKKNEIMPWFNWFSRQSGRSKTTPPYAALPQRSSTASPASPASPALGKNSLPDNKPLRGPDAQLVDRKVKRHARREQLYVAIREAMTRAGVLSASYKFKVLSLDPHGDQFLVMMDVAPGLSSQTDKFTDIENLLISTAKSSFSMDVTSVYWRTDNSPAGVNAGIAVNAVNVMNPVNAVNFGVNQPASVAPHPAASGAVRPAANQPAAPRYDPIHDEEMAAFRLALLTASANSSAIPDGSGKSRSGLRSFTLITGFEDTEMPESSAAPALSATQYGELR